MKHIYLFLLCFFLSGPLAAQKPGKLEVLPKETSGAEAEEIMSLKQNLNSRRCVAGSYTQFQNCLRNNSYILLTQNILLGDNEMFVLNGLSNVVIDGGARRFGFNETPERFANENYVSDRLTAQGGVYFFVYNSNGVVFKNLTLLSTPSGNGGCVNGEAKHSEDACRAMVWIRSSRNVSLLGNTFDARKKFQLHVIGVDGFLISGNTFKNAATYALAFGPLEMGNKNGRITQNSFYRAGANGMIGGDLQNVLIDRNLFESNHLLTQFYGYGGGHIDITTRTQRSGTFNVKILNNSFLGKDSNQSHGIEFTDFTSTLNSSLPVRNIEVAYNLIEGNTHQGIKFEDYKNTSVGRDVYIHHNVLKDNISSGISGLVLNNHPLFAWENTTILTRIGYTGRHSFDTKRLTCKIKATGTCAVDIKWTAMSNQNRAVVITVRYADKLGDQSTRTVFARSGGQGSFSQAADWITKRPVVFEMYDADNYQSTPSPIWATPLAQIVVGGTD